MAYIDNIQKRITLHMRALEVLRQNGPAAIDEAFQALELAKTEAQSVFDLALAATTAAANHVVALHTRWQTTKARQMVRTEAKALCDESKAVITANALTLKERAKCLAKAQSYCFCLGALPTELTMSDFFQAVDFALVLQMMLDTSDAAQLFKTELAKHGLLADAITLLERKLITEHMIMLAVQQAIEVYVQCDVHDHDLEQRRQDALAFNCALASASACLHPWTVSTMLQTCFDLDCTTQSILDAWYDAVVWTTGGTIRAGTDTAFRFEDVGFPMLWSAEPLEEEAPEPRQQLVTIEELFEIPPPAPQPFSASATDKEKMEASNASTIMELRDTGLVPQTKTPKTKKNKAAIPPTKKNVKVKEEEGEAKTDTSTVICTRFNSGKGCPFNPCTFRHVCAKCQSAAHKKQDCPDMAKTYAAIAKQHAAKRRK